MGGSRGDPNSCASSWTSVLLTSRMATFPAIAAVLFGNPPERFPSSRHVTCAHSHPILGLMVHVGRKTACIYTSRRSATSWRDHARVGLGLVITAFEKHTNREILSTRRIYPICGCQALAVSTMSPLATSSGRQVPVHFIRCALLAIAQQFSIIPRVRAFSLTQKRVPYVCTSTRNKTFPVSHLQKSRDARRTSRRQGVHTCVTHFAH